MEHRRLRSKIVSFLKPPLSKSSAPPVVPMSASPTVTGSSAKADQASSNVSLSSPICEDPSRLSLCDLPTEIRLEVFNHLLNLSNIPRSYGYTGPAPALERRSANNHRANSDTDYAPKVKPATRKHGMVFVSKTLGAEYRQAFYERTRFFLRIDSHNAFTAIPALAQGTSAQDEQQGVPNFWNAPTALLASVRHCTLYIELGDIAASPRSTHSLSQVVRASTDIFEARRVREEMKLFSSFNALKAGDTAFDAAIREAVERLLAQMGQLRSIQLVWETSVPNRARFTTTYATDWMWSSLGQSFVEGLRKRANLRSMQVQLGDSFGDTVYVAQRSEEGKWEGGLKDEQRR